jgi:Leucine-rich repeat (LRR) protein
MQLPLGEISDSKITELSDITLLEKFTNLQQLILFEVKFPESAIPLWMNFLTNLGITDIQKRFAIDLTPLEKLDNLKSLGIIGTPVISITPLSKLENLQELIIVNSEFSGFESLKNFKNLKNLTLAFCPTITDEQIADLKKALPEVEITSRFNANFLTRAEK